MALDADGLPGHLPAGAAVEPAHGPDVVVIQEALDQVALPQQVSPLPVRQLRVPPDGLQQQLLQLPHPGDPAPGEHPPHQHQQGRGMLHQHLIAAVIQQLQHLFGPQSRQQDARVLLHHLQGGVPPACLTIGRQGLQILSVFRVPVAVPGLIRRLLLRGQGVEVPLGAGLHHVVEPVPPAGQSGDKGVFGRQVGQNLRRVRLLRNKPGHLPGELVRQAHHRQELLPPGRQRPQHGGGEHIIDVRRLRRGGPPVRQGLQMQIHGGHPPLGGLLQLRQLLPVQGRAEPVGIGRQLIALQPQLSGADAVQPPAQPQHLVPGQDLVPAGGDQMHIIWQSCRQFAQKVGHPPVRHQVQVVQKHIPWLLPPQLPAQGVGQQTGGGRVPGALEALQRRQPRVPEGPAAALPQGGQAVGIDADADGAARGLGPQEPVHRRGLAVAHGGRYHRQGAAAHRLQTGPESWGNIDRAGVRLSFCHEKLPPYRAI